MSNRIRIEPTKFIDVQTGSESLGFRIFDDYESLYDNTWDSIPDNDMDILRAVMRCDHPEIRDIMGYLVSVADKGIYIGNQWYEYSEIAEILEAGYEEASDEEG